VKGRKRDVILGLHPRMTEAEVPALKAGALPRLPFSD
jgi:hypothetical protein